MFFFVFKTSQVSTEYLTDFLISWKTSILRDAQKTLLVFRYFKSSGRLTYDTDLFNPFIPNATFLHPLKTIEKGRDMVHWERMG